MLKHDNSKEQWTLVIAPSIPEYHYELRLIAQVLTQNVFIQIKIHVL
jgi:hypothetical protein